MLLAEDNPRSLSKFAPRFPDNSSFHSIRNKWQTMNNQREPDNRYSLHPPQNGNLWYSLTASHDIGQYGDLGTMDNYYSGEHGSPIRSLRGHARLEHRSRWGSRVLWLLGVAILFTSSTGCATLQGVRDYIAYNDVTDDFVIGWRNYVWANKAWAAERHCYEGHPQLADFGEGFRAGYRDVAAGGNGCPPPLPPRKYWAWKYQSPEGQAKIAAWFSGYPHGAAVAEQEGAGNWRDIPVSYAIQQEYSAEFEQGLIPRCDGPRFPHPDDPIDTMQPHESYDFDYAPPLLHDPPSDDFPGYGDTSSYDPRTMLMMPQPNAEPVISSVGYSTNHQNSIHGHHP